MTSQQLQSLRNLGNECEEAADEIDRLNAQRRELQAERERLLDSLARAGLEASRMVLQERDRCFRLAEYAISCAKNTEWNAVEDVLERIGSSNA